MIRSKKFINQKNLRLMLKKRTEGSPRLDSEDLPLETYEDCSKLLSDMREIDHMSLEALKARQ